MSKANDKALALMEKNKQSSENFKDAFEGAEKTAAVTFRAIFESTPLSENENTQIYNLLEDASGRLTEGEIGDDHQNLAEITTQIRAIERQSILLHGERIHKAQQILKKYHDGTFSKWLQLAYGNRQTPYSMLQFYDLFSRLEKDEKELINSMPKRAAYVLASRSGEIEKKIEIIKEHHDSSPEEIIRTVQETFPLKESDRRKTSKRASDVDLLKVILPRIRRLKDKKSLEKVLALVEKLFSEAPGVEEDPNQIDMFEPETE